MRVTTNYNLGKLYPKLAKQWHPTKNRDLTADQVTPFSNKKVWWRCGQGHEWEAAIGDRSSGNGCPYCAGQRATKENNLAVKYPELIKEWHPTKNKNLAPYDVMPSSGKKVWWLCSQEHEWRAFVFNRTRGGQGCPYCAGKRSSKDYNLAIKNPELAKEWHPTKNDKLTPYDVTPGSGKKVWWKCNQEHEWDATVNNRKNGRGCPYCAGKRKV